MVGDVFSLLLAELPSLEEHVGVTTCVVPSRPDPRLIGNPIQCIESRSVSAQNGCHLSV